MSIIAVSPDPLDVITLRDVLAKLGAIHVEQPRAMAVFLFLHFVEDGCRRGIGLAQAVGEVSIDAPVGLLERNGKGEDFGFGQVAEVSGHGRILARLWGTASAVQSFVGQGFSPAAGSRPLSRSAQADYARRQQRT